MFFLIFSLRDSWSWWNHGHNSIMAVLQLNKIESNSQPKFMLASFFCCTWPGRLGGLLCPCFAICFHLRPLSNIHVNRNELFMYSYGYGNLVFYFFPFTLLYLLNTPVDTIYTSSYLVLSVLLRAPQRMVPTHYASSNLPPCVRIHWSFSYFSLQRFGGFFLFPAVLICQLFCSLCGLDRDDHPFRPVQPKSKCWHRQ